MADVSCVVITYHHQIDAVILSYAREIIVGNPVYDYAFCIVKMGQGGYYLVRSDVLFDGFQSDFKAQISINSESVCPHCNPFLFPVKTK